MAAKIKTGDYVQVISGRDKGKKGKVTKVFPKDGRVVVDGVALVTRHNKPSYSNPEGSITRFPAAIDVSNVAHLDPKDNKPCRVGFKVLKDGTKVRVSKRSGEVIDG